MLSPPHLLPEYSVKSFRLCSNWGRGRDGNCGKVRVKKDSHETRTPAKYQIISQVSVAFLTLIILSPLKEELKILSP